MMDIKLEDIPEVQLKSMIYDNQKTIQQCQNLIRMFESELYRRVQEANKPKEEEKKEDDQAKPEENSEPKPEKKEVKK